MSPEEIERAIWEGDIDTLDDRARCVCCCWEHTHLGCPARVWNGCRSGLGPGEVAYDEKAWAKHYAEHHGLSEAEFYGHS